MHPTPELASLLRRTADRIQSQRWGFWDTEYRWQDSTRCNCGLLVREALGWDGDQLSLRIHRGTWRSIAQTAYRTAALTLRDPLQQEQRCSVTGLRLGYVFAKMAEWGFDRPEDFAALEELSDPVILARLAEKGLEQVQRNSAMHVVLYMRELAGWIDEQLQAQAQINRLTQTLHKEEEVPVRQSVRLG
ncbi:hypothetical protein L1047_04575 [Synechococcus sp. Nb3U1]|uniref:hypothetical protein n=1 Tax=Synechococcus sp. Nb3U1 TaxID=1914529 RepID=UPI001F1DA12B|nr:hypothetical protein [Synechococcus sp. Nb3U1]MCF2970469.1 hypothetical protein [Synechococcus sp. Nb3U1]